MFQVCSWCGRKHHQVDDFSNSVYQLGKKVILCVLLLMLLLTLCPSPLSATTDRKQFGVEDGQGVCDIGRNTYANLMTPKGNKNCQPLRLFRVEPSLVTSDTFFFIEEEYMVLLSFFMYQWYIQSFLGKTSLELRFSLLFELSLHSVCVTIWDGPATHCDGLCVCWILFTILPWFAEKEGIEGIHESSTSCMLRMGACC